MTILGVKGNTLSTEAESAAIYQSEIRFEASDKAKSLYHTKKCYKLRFAKFVFYLFVLSRKMVDRFKEKSRPK